MEKNLSAKLSLIYIAIYGALACFFPFLIYYFQSKGLSYTEMGIVFAVVSITGVIAQPIWGFVTDKYSNKRTILIITMILSSLAVYSLVFAYGFYFSILSIILLLIFQSPVTPVADAYSYEIIEHHQKLQYGRIRLMGSFGYAMIALFLGYLVKYYGINSCYVVYSIVMLFGVFFVFSIEYKGEKKCTKISLHDIINLIRDKKFSLLMLTIIFINIAIGSNGSYIPVLIDKTGGDVTQLGMVWFIVAISELPALFFSVKLLQKYGELNLYILGIALFAVRYFLDSLCNSYIPVIVIQLMQGITFTFYLVASLQYLNQITSANMKTSAITLHAAATSIGGVIGNMGGGMLLEHTSIFILYKILALACVTCLCLLIVLKNIDSLEDKGMSFADISCNRK